MQKNCILIANILAMTPKQLNSLCLCLLFFILLSCDSITENKELKTVYFPNSEIVKQTVEFKEGKKNGALKEYFRNGKLKALQRYVNDTLNDTSFFYHENGKLASIQLYKNRQRFGCWQKYNKEGKLFWEACFKNNEFHGTNRQYSYRSLKLIEVQNYQDGQKHGKQETFYNNGKPRSVSFFDKGEALPGTVEWQDNGKKIVNDFQIHVVEVNDILMKNQLSFFIHLDKPRNDDRLYQELIFMGEKETKAYSPIEHEDGHFVIRYTIPKGDFIMKEVKLLAKRKTSMGNTIIKTKSFVASANNY